MEIPKTLWHYMRQRILAIQIFVLLQLIRKNTLKNLKIEKLIKKHKGVRRDAPRMNFVSYSEKIYSIGQIDIARNDKILVQK